MRTDRRAFIATAAAALSLVAAPALAGPFGWGARAARPSAQLDRFQVRIDLVALPRLENPKRVQLIHVPELFAGHAMAASVSSTSRCPLSTDRRAASVQKSTSPATSSPSSPASARAAAAWAWSSRSPPRR